MDEQDLAVIREALRNAAINAYKKGRPGRGSVEAIIAKIWGQLASLYPEIRASLLEYLVGYLGMQRNRSCGWQDRLRQCMTRTPQQNTSPLLRPTSEVIVSSKKKVVTYAASRPRPGMQTKLSKRERPIYSLSKHNSRS